MPDFFLLGVGLLSFPSLGRGSLRWPVNLDQNLTILRHHTSIHSVDDLLCRPYELARQCSIEWHHLRAELVLKSLELVVSGGEVAPVEGCGGGSEARKQRLLAPCGKSRILHQPNQNC